jgi:hypothetical protein
VASPTTVATDVLMLSILVDVHEGRDVAMADVTGAYLKATMDDFVLLKFTGESVDILYKMNAKYKKRVVIEKATLKYSMHNSQKLSMDALNWRCCGTSFSRSLHRRWVSF